MSNIQYSFKRYEKKYLLTEEQLSRLMPALEKYMQPEEYGLHTINNIYFDTEDYQLIRNSLSKPPYKEKFRLRCYGVPEETDTVFAEIKKKFDGIVYKRRIAASPKEIEKFLNGETLPNADYQIQRELRWFLFSHEIRPQVFIAYERMAYFGAEDSTLRITFDRNIRYRTDNLILSRSDDASPILDDDRIVMEVKISDAVPLWLAKELSRLEIYPVSFSKYGTCYEKHLVKQFLIERKAAISC